jgi:hypothetical protein
MSPKRNDPIGVLVAFSFFRDEIPWLYELGLEVYRDPIFIGTPARGSSRW